MPEGVADGAVREHLHGHPVQHANPSTRSNGRGDTWTDANGELFLDHVSRGHDHPGTTDCYAIDLGLLLAVVFLGERDDLFQTTLGFPQHPSSLWLVGGGTTASDTDVDLKMTFLVEQSEGDDLSLWMWNHDW